MLIFAYLPESNFSSEIKSVIYVRFKNVQGKETYGSAYEQTMDKNIAASEKLFKDRPEERAAEIRKEAQAELLPKKMKWLTAWQNWLRVKRKSIKRKIN